jgi:hypothetical protein
MAGKVQSFKYEIQAKDKVFKKYRKSTLVE